MGKELEALECLEEIEQRLECCINGGLVLLKDDEVKINTIKQALHRLEAIDNAEPTKAMECLDSMYVRLPQWDLCRNLDQYDTIKQALIQAERDRKKLENLLNIHPCKDAKNKAESFELILFKNVDLNLIRQSANAESYNSKIPYYRTNLTNNEFTFLEEIIRQSLLQKIEEEE